METPRQAKRATKTGKYKLLGNHENDTSLEHNKPQADHTSHLTITRSSQGQLGSVPAPVPVILQAHTARYLIAQILAPRAPRI